MMTYTVKHYWSNPLNNETFKFDDLNEATNELIKYSSDEDACQCSELFTDNGVLATFDWFSQELESYDESIIASRVID